MWPVPHAGFGEPAVARSVEVAFGGAGLPGPNPATASIVRATLGAASQDPGSGWSRRDQSAALRAARPYAGRRT